MPCTALNPWTNRLSKSRRQWLWVGSGGVERHPSPLMLTCLKHCKAVLCVLFLVLGEMWLETVVLSRHVPGHLCNSSHMPSSTTLGEKRKLTLDLTTCLLHARSLNTDVCLEVSKYSLLK